MTAAENAAEKKYPTVHLERERSAFLAGAAWQRREDVRVVREEYDQAGSWLERVTLASAIAALKRSGKGK